MSAAGAGLHSITAKGSARSRNDLREQSMNSLKISEPGLASADEKSLGLEVESGQ
jgi:hypothetical protein